MKRTFLRLFNEHPNMFILSIIFFVTFTGILTFITHYSRAIEPIDWRVGVEETNGWQFFSYVDDKKVDLLYQDQQIYADDSIELIYQQRVITETINNPTLLIQVDEHFYQIFLDDQPLYTNEYFYSEIKHEFTTPFLLTLPQNITGKKVTISFLNKRDMKTKPIEIELMSYLNFITNTIDYTISRLLPVACFFFISMFLLIMFLYRLYLKYFDLPTLLLSMTAILFMFFLSTSYFEIFLINSNYRYFKYIFYVLYPLPLSFFFYLKMKSSQRIYLPVIVSHMILAFAYLLLHCFNLATPLIVLCYTMLSSLVSIYTLSLMIREAHQKNHFFSISLKILGVTMFSFLLFFCLIHFINYPFSIELFERILTLYNDLELRFLKDTLSLSLMLIVFMVSLSDYLALIIRRNVTLQALTMKNELAVKSYQLMETNILKTRALKHDLKHHISVLKAYSQNQSYDKVDAYLTMLIDEQQILPTISYTDNFLVNAILTTRLEEAKNSGILTDHEVYTKAEIMLDETDLCSFLMNMLDNAIEACQQVPNEDERWMKIKIQQKDSFLIISCQNSFVEPVNFSDHRYISSKKDKKNHGFGISTMELIAEKYHSVLSIHYSDQVFTLKTNLKIPDNR